MTVRTPSLTLMSRSLSGSTPGSPSDLPDASTPERALCGRLDVTACRYPERRVDSRDAMVARVRSRATTGSDDESILDKRALCVVRKKQRRTVVRRGPPEPITLRSSVKCR
jgi:hypothetical protein